MACALFEVERVSSIQLRAQEVTRVGLAGIEYPDVSYPPSHHADVDLDELHHSYVRQIS